MIYNYYNIDFRTILIFSKGMIYLMLIYDRKILSVLAAAVMLTACGTSETSVSTETNTATSVKTMTTTTGTPTETTTTTLQPETEAETTTEKLPEALVYSNEIKADDLDTEEREIFEKFISEYDLKGRFYDSIRDTNDTPKFYFIPNDKLLNNDEFHVFREKTIHIMVPIDDANDYISEKNLSSLKEKNVKFVVVRELSIPESQMVNTDDIPYYYIEYNASWWNDIGNVFVPDT